jgi:hypothetical protein
MMETPFPLTADNTGYNKLLGVSIDSCQPKTKRATRTVVQAALLVLVSEHTMSYQRSLARWAFIVKSASRCNTGARGADPDEAYRAPTPDN